MSSAHAYLLLSVVLLVAAVTLLVFQLAHTPMRLDAASGDPLSPAGMLRLGAFLASMVGSVLAFAWSIEEGVFSSLDD